MKRFAFAMAALLLMAANAHAEESNLVENWEGLTVGVSTVDDALTALGEPRRDKEGEDVDFLGIKDFYELAPLPADVVARTGEKTYDDDPFRVLEYEDGLKEAYKKVRLAFLEDRLVAIMFEFEESLDPNQISSLFGVEFRPDGEAAARFNTEDVESPGGAIRAAGGGASAGLADLLTAIGNSGDNYMLFAEVGDIIAEAKAEEEVFSFSPKQNVGPLPGRVKKMNFIASEFIRTPDL